MAAPRPTAGAGRRSLMAELSLTDEVDDATLARIKAGLAASDPALGPYAPLPLAVLLHEPELRISRMRMIRTLLRRPESSAYELEPCSV
jgi:hypothetical protein